MNSASERGPWPLRWFSMPRRSTRRILPEIVFGRSAIDATNQLVARHLFAHEAEDVGCGLGGPPHASHPEHLGPPGENPGIPR